ncbi:hypothetical protein DCAR_0729909 [Daucus carota subsp. sativus]|uniref:Pectinesterase inhibitor domain-containing protein n=2 Tax=Daucus carota subsp. sativus TaxID=79200 RepID=A0AAF0XLP8_DAUCS|nr:hypothetical protein DCAR_0729909 [Daucus carota subsp. sativus]
MESKTNFINGHQATAITLLTLLTIAAITYISATKPPHTPSLSTQLDPTILFNTSLYTSLSQLKLISSLPQTLITSSTDTPTISALQDCAVLFDDAVAQLNKSITLTTVPPGELAVLTRAEIRALNAWISAAMTDQETCLDGLEEMGSTVCDEVRAKVQVSRQCMSYSLAILASIQAVGMFGRYLQ